MPNTSVDFIGILMVIFTEQWFVITLNPPAPPFRNQYSLQGSNFQLYEANMLTMLSLDERSFECRVKWNHYGRFGSYACYLVKKIDFLSRLPSRKGTKKI